MRESRNKSYNKRVDEINTPESRKCSKVKDNKKTNFGVKRNVRGDCSISNQSPNSDMLPTSASCSSPTKSDYSEESGTDHSGSSNTGTNSSGNTGSRSSIPSTSNKKHSSGGIKFYPGLRLEAKDLGNDIWYAVKVVEVDQEEDEILIHFEKWSQRYDEWIPMDSSRLRPIQEPPGGFTKKSVKVFKVGENVMATWSDSRKYPAKVKTVLGNDRYEVLFFDGFTKNLKGGRMTLLSDEELAKIEQLKPGIGPSNDVTICSPPATLSKKYASEVIEPTLGTKEERRERKRKLNVAELFHFKKRRKVDSPSMRVPMSLSKSSQQGNSLDHNRSNKKQPVSEGILPLGDSSKLQMIKSDIAEVSGDKFTPRSDVAVDYGGNKKREGGIKMNIGDTMDKSRKKSKSDASSQMNVQKESKLLLSKSVKRKFNRYDGSRKAQSINSSNRKEENVKNEEGNEAPESILKPQEEWVPKGQPAYVVDGTGGPRKSIVVDDPRVPPGWSRHFIQRMSGHSAGKWDVFFVCPQGRKFRTRHELRSYYEDRGEVFPTEQFDFSLGRRKNKSQNAERDASSTPDGHISGSNKTNQQISSNLAHPSKGISTETPIRRVKTLLPRIRASDSVGAPPISDNDTLDEHSNISDSSVAYGDLKIEKENDAYKCPKDGCCKNFRKESLLQMHMKHYHPEYNRFVASTPNVADLAYARTIGEPVEELHPRTPRPSFVQKISRFEAMRRAQVNIPSGVTNSSQAVTYPTPHPSIGILHTSVSGASDISGNGTPCHSSFDHHNTPSSIRSLDTPTLDSSDMDSVTHNTSLSGSNINVDIPKRTIRTLMPVTRTSVSEPSNIEIADDSSEVVDVTEVTPSPRISLSATEQDLEHSDVKGVKRSQTPPMILPYVSMGQTKSLRMVRRRHMSDFHMEPVMKKRKPTESDESSQNTLVAGSSSRQTRVETLRREELVNCTCGYPEEDGLMIQCDLCMCWQHGLCNNIEHEDDVPEKYVCIICLHPSRERPSKHFLHDQDWLKEGRLPTLSFRSKNDSEISQRTNILKRSHDLIATILQLQRVVHSLRVKVNIAELADHPKLYLWNQSWEKVSLYHSLSNVQGSTQQNILLPPPEAENFKEEKCFDHGNLNIGHLEKPSGLISCQQTPLCNSVGNDENGDLTECQSTDLEGETSDICPVRESTNLLAEDCDTKDTYFSQDSMSSVKAEIVPPDIHQTKVDSKENLQLSNDLILDSSINIGNETEVSTICGVTVKEEIEDNEITVKEIKVEPQLEDDEDFGEKGNEEKSNNSPVDTLNDTSTDKNSDQSKEIAHMEDNELQLPFCQKDLMHLATSMVNKLESLDVPEENQPSVLTQQRVPQPEAPIVPKECRKTLLDHIESFHQQMDSRLTSLETQIAGLESMDPYLAYDESTDHQTREAVQMLLHDLLLLRDVAALN